MSDSTRPTIRATEEAGRQFSSQHLRRDRHAQSLAFWAVADYSATPHLAPAAPISGEAAYRLDIEHTLPHLKESGGELLFLGKGGAFLIGPSDERWDAAMLVRQSSVGAFMEFASNPEYMAGIGHRTAALEDSRRLPLVEGSAAEVLADL